MKRAANEELAMQHKPRKSWISQDTLLLVKYKRVYSKGQPLEECRDDGGVYAELCKRVKKSTSMEYGASEYMDTETVRKG